MALPQLLAGPILRRTDETRVTVWIATVPEVGVRGSVLRLEPGGPRTPLAEAGARTVHLGPRLAVHLLSLTPAEGRFPSDEVLGYDVELVSQGGAAGRGVEALGLARGAHPLAYGPLGLPTFVVPKRPGPLNLLHGSCRLLHGGGEDAFLAVDEEMARRSTDVRARPGAAFLTGDQIYADDVASPAIGHVRRLASELMGPADITSVPGMPRLSEVPVDGRDELVRKRAGFTSARASNHLMSFGEFAAMYLFAWSEALWPDAFPTADEAAGPAARWGRRRRRRYGQQVRRLEAARRGLPSVRRVLANVPIYMSFDDHDVTDDWNLTRKWRDAVRESPSGRRIVANALASYWAFQGWGNAPDCYDDHFIEVISGFLTGDGAVTGDDFDHTLWSFDRWSFFAPTEPPSIVLDTRTQRDYDSPEGGARLIGSKARDRVAELVQRSGYARQDPLILVSPVPVFGFELQERRQKYLVDRLGPYEIDFEAWHSNLRGLVDLMQLLVEEVDPSACLLLSGDVHYGVNARASFEIEGKELRFVQLVSSAQKHAGRLAQSTINALGRLLRKEHLRMGWDRPPDCKRKGPLADRIMLRSVNSDEWADDSPVFLAPRDVRLLGIDQAPDFRERRLYVRPRGRMASILVGENNTGLVSLLGDRVTHRLLSRSSEGTTEHVAEMSFRRDP